MVGPARSVRGALGACALALALAAPTRAELNLEGTWYLLVHFQDSETAKPEAWRWDDRIWVFERQGDQLQWTEYPIVVFQDESGRFENLGGNRASRVVQAWEPNEGQLRNIIQGLEVNSRGSKSKKLGTQADGWHSTGAPAAGGASIITYVEEWSIRDPQGLPVFVREEFMGSPRAESMEGRTEYRTEDVREGGDLLVGHFDRDGTRVGRFRLMRSGEAGRVKGSGLTQNQRFWQLFYGSSGLSQDEIDALVAGRMKPGTGVSDELREKVRAQVHADVEEIFRQRGEDPERQADKVDSLTRQIEELLLDQGKSAAEVQQMLRSGAITP
jgi:hypothetical protein